MATLEQLIIFFLLIGVGVIARKVGVITPGNTPQLTSLVFNFAMPAIILSGITTEQPHISGKDLSIVLTSAFTTLILLIICSRMLARILRYTTVTSNDDTLALQSSAAGSAQNVGIQILDRTGEVLVLDGATISAKTDLIDGTNILPFQARYIALGQSVAGTANADATFKVQYL
ncbi:TPA: fimbrial protein [Escherichia coli]|nr:fimbrial protein [Escherichia coli]